MWLKGHQHKVLLSRERKMEGENLIFIFFLLSSPGCNIAPHTDNRHLLPFSRNKFQFMSPSEEKNFSFSGMMIKTAFGIFLSKFVVVYHANSSLHHSAS